MTCVPEVARKKVPLAPAVVVTPAGIVRFPNITRVLFKKVPAKPVRLRFFAVLHPKLSVPAVILKFGELVSVPPVLVAN